MLVISIPTNTTFTGNQTLINLHVSGSVDITPNDLKTETTITETKFCKQKILHPNVSNSRLLHGIMLSNQFRAGKLKIDYYSPDKPLKIFQH